MKLKYFWIGGGVISGVLNFMATNSYIQATSNIKSWFVAANITSPHWANKPNIDSSIKHISIVLALIFICLSIYSLVRERASKKDTQKQGIYFKADIERIGDAFNSLIRIFETTGVSIQNKHDEFLSEWTNQVLTFRKTKNFDSDLLIKKLDLYSEQLEKIEKDILDNKFGLFSIFKNYKKELNGVLKSHNPTFGLHNKIVNMKESLLVMPGISDDFSKNAMIEKTIMPKLTEVIQELEKFNFWMGECRARILDRGKSLSIDLKG